MYTKVNIYIYIYIYISVGDYVAEFNIILSIICSLPAIHFQKK